MLVSLFGVDVLAYLALFFFSFLAARKVSRDLRDAERRLYRSTSQLTPGPATLIGTVQHARGRDHALRVEVVQAARFEPKFSVHFWREQERQVFATPFYLVLDGGGRVRIEPGESPEVVDDFDGPIEKLGDDLRKQSSSLEPGEKAMIKGTLEKATDPETTNQAYRGSHGQGWVLSGPIRISTQEFSLAPLEERSRVHRKFSFYILAAFLVILVLNSGHHLRVIAGEEATASILGTRVYTCTDSDGEDDACYEFHALAPWGEVLRRKISHGEFKSLAKGDKLTFFHYRQHFIQFGDRLWITTFGAIGSVVVFLMLVIGYWSKIRSLSPTQWQGEKLVHMGLGPINYETGHESTAKVFEKFKSSE